MVRLESESDLESKGSSGSCLRQRDRAKSNKFMSIKKCREYLILLCCTILISGTISYEVSKHFQQLPPSEKALKRPECRKCDAKDANFDVKSPENDDNVRCCETVRYSEILPVPGRQIQPETQPRRKTGAQLTINQTLLKGDDPKLVWSHKSPSSYLDGINHVTYRGFDCLEITADDRYLITIQLTYRFSLDKPPTSVKTYFQLVRFRNNNQYVIAQSHFMVPSRSSRSKSNIVPHTMTLSASLLRADVLCVTARNPALIYVSMLDNFFGVVSIGNV